MFQSFELKSALLHLSCRPCVTRVVYHIRMYVCMHLHISMKNRDMCNFLVTVVVVAFWCVATFCSTLVGHGPHTFDQLPTAQSIGMRTLLICASVLHSCSHCGAARSVEWSVGRVSAPYRQAFGGKQLKLLIFCCNNCFYCSFTKAQTLLATTT